MVIQIVHKYMLKHMLEHKTPDFALLKWIKPRKFHEQRMSSQPLSHCYECKDFSRKFPDWGNHFYKATVHGLSRKHPESGMCRQPLLQSYSAAWIVLGNTLNQGCVDNHFSIAINAWIVLGSTQNQGCVDNHFSCMDCSRKYPESGMCRNHFSIAISAWIVLGNTLNQGCVEATFLLL